MTYTSIMESAQFNYVICNFLLLNMKPKNGKSKTNKHLVPWGLFFSNSAKTRCKLIRLHDLVLIHFFSPLTQDLVLTPQVVVTVKLFVTVVTKIVIPCPLWSTSGWRQPNHQRISVSPIPSLSCNKNFKIAVYLLQHQLLHKLQH